jgi:hypothetical protein
VGVTEVRGAIKPGTRCVGRELLEIRHDQPEQRNYNQEKALTQEEQCQQIKKPKPV